MGKALELFRSLRRGDNEPDKIIKLDKMLSTSDYAAVSGHFVDFADFDRRSGGRDLPRCREWGPAREQWVKALHDLQRTHPPDWVSPERWQRLMDLGKHLVA